MSDSQLILKIAADQPYNAIKRIQDFPPLSAFELSDNFWDYSKQSVTICGTYAARQKGKLNTLGFLHLFTHSLSVYQTLYERGAELYRASKHPRVFDDELGGYAETHEVLRFFHDEYDEEADEEAMVPPTPIFVFDNVRVILRGSPSLYDLPATAYALYLCEKHVQQCYASCICYSGETESLIVMQAAANNKLRTNVPPTISPEEDNEYPPCRLPEPTDNAYDPPTLKDITFNQVHRVREILRWLHERVGFPADRYYAPDVEREDHALWSWSPMPPPTPSPATSPPSSPAPSPEPSE